MITAWVLTFGLIMSTGQVETYQSVYTGDSGGLGACASEAIELKGLPEVKFAQCDLTEVDPDKIEDERV